MAKLPPAQLTATGRTRAGTQRKSCRLRRGARALRERQDRGHPARGHLLRHQAGTADPTSAHGRPLKTHSRIPSSCRRTRKTSSDRFVLWKDDQHDVLGEGPRFSHRFCPQPPNKTFAGLSSAIERGEAGKPTLPNVATRRSTWGSVLRRWRARRRCASRRGHRGRRRPPGGIGPRSRSRRTGPRRRSFRGGVGTGRR